MCVCVCVCVCVHVLCLISQSCPTLCNPIDCSLACQAPRSMGFSRQKYWSGLPFPSPGDFSDPGIKHESPVSPASAGRFFTTEPPGKPTWAVVF